MDENQARVIASRMIKAAQAFVDACKGEFEDDPDLWRLALLDDFVRDWKEGRIPSPPDSSDPEAWDDAWRDVEELARLLRVAVDMAEGRQSDGEAA